MSKWIVLVLVAIFSNPATAAGSVSKSLLKSKSEYISDSNSICTEKWTKRGVLNSEMYNYCMKQQAEAYDKLVILDNYSDKDFYSKIAFPYCNKRWTTRGVTNVEMLANCLDEEVEGMKDVMYFRKQYGEDAVNKVVAAALSSFGSWNMAAYEVKRHFEKR